MVSALACITAALPMFRARMHVLRARRRAAMADAAAARIQAAWRGQEARRLIAKRLKQVRGSLVGLCLLGEGEK